MGRTDALHRRVTLYGPAGAAERLLFSFLVPCGWIYGLVGKIREGLYHRGLLRSRCAGVPVVSVGNLSVGGTGKTPTVDFILKFYLSCGKRAAVVSRGYGGSQKRGVGVVSTGNGPVLSPEICGDEPFLLALRNPEALVFVAPKRIEGVQAAEACGAEVIVLDDGFQHMAVRRDLDIVLMDGRRPLGNGFPLPAGNLREFPSALKRSDILILTRWSDDDEIPPAVATSHARVLHSRHVQGNRAIELSGGDIPLTQLAGKKGIAFAGIAHPENFFEDLFQKGLDLEATVSFRDHSVYSEEEIRKLVEASHGKDYLITTEKDGVKLKSGDFTAPCYQIPLDIEFREREYLEMRLISLLEVK